jgi:hypothetical protein
VRLVTQKRGSGFFQFLASMSSAARTQSIQFFSTLLFRSNAMLKNIVWSDPSRVDDLPQGWRAHTAPSERGSKVLQFDVQVVAPSCALPTLSSELIQLLGNHVILQARRHSNDCPRPRSCSPRVRARLHLATIKSRCNRPLPRSNSSHKSSIYQLNVGRSVTRASGTKSCMEDGLRPFFRREIIAPRTRM